MYKGYSCLPQSFYNRNSEVVARDLLGKFLVRKIGSHLLVGRIVETEAYLPFGDPASHSYKGLSARNKSMFTDSGHAYVYRMRHHTLFNVVTEGPDKPGAVLIRALEPIEGLDEMLMRRMNKNVEQLARGPANVCVALGITIEQDGVLLTEPESDIYIAKGQQVFPHTIISTTRIGISKGKDMRLRFYVSDNLYVSKKIEREEAIVVTTASNFSAPCHVNDIFLPNARSLRKRMKSGDTWV